jgi:hypothetical protein
MLGESLSATRAYEEVLAAWPEDGRLDERMRRADLAQAYLDEGEPERAAEEALSAMRALREVGRLLLRLRRHRELLVLPELTNSCRAAVAACDD